MSLISQHDEAENFGAERAPWLQHVRRELRREFSREWLACFELREIGWPQREVALLIGCHAKTVEYRRDRVSQFLKDSATVLELTASISSHRSSASA